MVFGRSTKNKHPYDAALRGLLRSSTSGDRAMSVNLMCDHRVSRARETAFDRFGKRPRTIRELNRALVEYFERKVRVRTLPDFVYESLNGNNIVVGTSTGRHLVHKDVPLGRVIDINGLAVVFRWARSAGKGAFRDFPWSRDDTEISKWIDRQLRGAGPSRVEQFVVKVMDALNEYACIAAFQPTWATTWAALEPHVPVGPDRWISVLGVYKPAYPRWLLLLKYRVREAGTLVRPTQLDAGWASYHFPSPPRALLPVGGHPMDLRLTPPAGSVLPEFIHKQTRHSVTHWIDAGRNIGQTSSACGKKLTSERIAHHGLLTAVYGPTVVTWMPTCV
jgi:hypothetical protein